MTGRYVQIFSLCLESVEVLMAMCAEPPGPIDNKRICQMKSGVPTVITNSDYAQISEDMWKLLYGIYGGGPEVLLKPAAAQPQTLASRKTDEQADVKPEPIVDK